jgi:hypothetical protein
MINRKDKVKTLLATAAATVVVVAGLPAAAALPAGCNPLALNSIAWDRNQDKMPASSQRPDSIGSTNLIAAVDAFSGYNGSNASQGRTGQGSNGQGSSRPSGSGRQGVSSYQTGGSGGV